MCKDCEAIVYKEKVGQSGFGEYAILEQTACSHECTWQPVPVYCEVCDHWHRGRMEGKSDKVRRDSLGISK
jgi:hypothetical protein